MHSPLGDLAAQAAAEGYKPGSTPIPYLGANTAKLVREIISFSPDGTWTKSMLQCEDDPIRMHSSAPTLSGLENRMSNAV